MPTPVSYLNFQGDSGGPLVCYFKDNVKYLSGIISRGGRRYRNHTKIYVEKAVNLAKYTDWIRETTEKLNVRNIMSNNSKSRNEFQTSTPWMFYIFFSYFIFMHYITE